MVSIQTADLKKIIDDSERFTISIETYFDGDFHVEDAVDTLQEIESTIPEAEFYVFCDQLPEQEKIDEIWPNKNSRAETVGALLFSRHFDLLPYSVIIVSVKKELE